MRKIILQVVLFFAFVPAYSQFDSTFLKLYNQQVLEINNFKNELEKAKLNSSRLSESYKKDTLELLKEIKGLQKEISSERQKILDLNQNKLKQENSNLQTKVETLNRKIDSLNVIIFSQNQIISNKDSLIKNEKIISKVTAEKAKIDGKTESLSNIINSFKIGSFDELIRSSTKESLTRDMSLINENSEIQPILNDLKTYYISQKLLLEKFDSVKAKNAQTSLSKIVRQSQLLENCKENIESYQDYRNALKASMSDILKEDKKISLGDSFTQDEKFRKISSILAIYMFNYYNYKAYPYLFDIIFEIIKRKKVNPDASINDLFEKL